VETLLQCPTEKAQDGFHYLKALAQPAGRQHGVIVNLRQHWACADSMKLIMAATGEM